MARVVAELVVEGQQVFIRQMDESEDAVADVGRGAEQSGRQVSGLTSAMTALGGALATRELVQWGTDAAEYSRDLGAMQAKAETVLGDHVGEIRAFAEEHAARFGLARDELTGLAAGYADLLVPMGFTRGEAADLTEQTLQLAGALGEWSPQLGGAEHALGALGAAMTGEREQLKAYGIVIDEAAVSTELAARQLDHLTGEAERQARAQATLDLALRGSTDAQRQFAAGGDPAIVAAANSRAAYAEMRAELGEQLLPVLTTAQGLFADVVGVVAGLPAPVQTAGMALVGLGAAAVPIASTVRAVGELGGAAAGLRTRLSGVGTFLTGPWGLALAGATTAVGLFAAAKANARREVEEYVTALEADSGAIGENVRAHAVAELSQQGLLQQADLLGISVADLTDAILGNDNAYAAVSQTLQTYGERLINVDGWTAEQYYATRDLTSALGEESAQLVDSVRLAELRAEAMRSNATTTGLAASAHDSWNQVGGIQVAVAWELEAAHHASMGAAMAHASQMERLALQTQIATQSLADQLDAQRAAIDPVFAATSADRQLQEAQQRLGEARERARDIAADQTATSAELAQAHQDLLAAEEGVAEAALGMQGALVALNDAQASGETGASEMQAALQLLADQGLLAQENVEGLTGKLSSLEQQARDAATALLDASVQAGTFGYADSFVRSTVRGSGGGIIEDIPGSATLVAATSTAAPRQPISFGNLNFYGVDVSQQGAADQFANDFLGRVRVALTTILDEEASR